MLITCNKSDLAPVVSAVSRVVPSRAVVPILEGLECIAEDDKLTVQATDTDISLKMSVSAEVQEDGGFVVPAKRFADLVKKAPAEEIKIEVNPNKDFQLSVKSGRSRFHLNTFPLQDYPDVGDVPDKYQMEMPGEQLCEALSRVLFTASPHAVRPNFAGVYFDFNNASNILSIAATDTYRLGVVQIERPKMLTDTEPANVLVPTGPLNEVLRLVKDDTVKMCWSESKIAFVTGSFTIAGRLIDAKFPPYDKVIPSKNKLKVRVNISDLLSTLDRASLFVSPVENFAIVKVTVDGNNMHIESVAKDVGALAEDIPVETDGEMPMDARFNCKFLAEPLRYMGTDEVTLYLNGNVGAAVYQEDFAQGFKHLVLPVCTVSE